MWIYYFELKQVAQDHTASTERNCKRICFKHMVLQDNHSTWQDDSKDKGSAAGRTQGSSCGSSDRPAVSNPWQLGCTESLWLMITG